MKFEGQQVNIPIKGIMRAGTDNLCADGAMNEVIGMEFKDGSWLPYKESEDSWRVVWLEGTLQTLHLVENIKKVYVHNVTDNTEHYVFVRENGDVYYEYVYSGHSSSREGTTITTKHLTTSCKDLTFVGNMLCIVTNEGVECYLWKSGDYERSIDSPSSDIKLRVTYGLISDTHDTAVGVEYTDMIIGVKHASSGAVVPLPDEKKVSATVSKDVDRGKIISTMIAAKGEVRDRGGLTGIVIGCVCYRLKNNSIVAASAPILLGSVNQAFGSETAEKIRNLDNYVDRDFVLSATQEGIFIVPTLRRLTAGSETVTSPEIHDFSIFTTPKLKDIDSIEDEKRNLGTKEGAKEVFVFDEDITGSLVSVRHLRNSDNQDIHVILGEQGSCYVTARTTDPSDAGYPWSEEDPYNKTTGWAGTVINNNRFSYKDQNIPALPALACSRMHILYSVDTMAVQPDIKSNVFYNGYAASNKLQYKIDNLGNIKDSEVQSVCFFISPEVDVYDLSLETTYFDMMVHPTGYSSETDKETVGHSGSGWNHVGYSNTFFAKRRSSEKIIKDIEKINTLYLAYEVNVEELQQGDWIDIDTRGNLGDALLTREQMPLTAFVKDSLFPEHITAYNYRAHVYDYKTGLFGGYGLQEFSHNGGEGQYSESSYSGTGKVFNWEAKVELQDSSGKTTVVKYDSVQVDQLVKGLTPIITYPSQDAKSITIHVYEYDTVNETTKVYAGTFAFSHKMGLNISYYISPNLSPITLSEVEGEEAPSHVPSFAESNIYRMYRNGMRVSDVAYPNYFPTAYTYRAGGEQIIGLARLALPMSQDNFGRNSLIIFCTDGVYSLRVDDSGNGAYTNTDYVGPEVCVNRNSICEIGGAIFFAGDKGLMMVTGDVTASSNIQLYAPHLNGGPKFLPALEESKEAHGVYTKMLCNAHILAARQSMSFKGYVSNNDFVDFVKNENTHLVYISNKNKLLAYNVNYSYSYFIDIPTGNTTKLALSAMWDNGQMIGRELWSPSPVGSSVHKYHTLGYLSKSDDNIQCLIQSRPIKVQQDDKCSYRVVITGYFEGLTGNWADLVVMGSLDGDHWRTIGVKEKKLNGGFHNLGCLTERGSWKYLMFIFGGKLKDNSHIDSIDITVDGRYNNKKR